jgi:NADH-ubiquinone oxidoreductase chain 2
VLLSLRGTSAPCLWVALELNILRFLPIITSERVELSLEGALKYFLIQSVGSILFLVRALLLEGSAHLVSSALISVSIFLKLGAAPLHGWFISLMRTVSLRTLFYLSTTQKIIPLIILSGLLVGGPLLWLTLLATLIVSSISGFSTLPLTKILAVSSLNNLI